jgi:hypothetical protein
VSLVSACRALVSVELLLGIVVDLQDVVGLLEDALLLLGLAKVIQGGFSLTQSWSSGVHGLGRGVEEEWPAEPLVLRRVEEWRLFFSLLEERLFFSLLEERLLGHLGE